jgi:tetratricopeptide (TPR) repeat protein
MASGRPPPPPRRARRTSAWVLGGLLALVAAVHAPLVREDPLLSRDDLTLVRPLERMGSLSDYAAALRGGALMDVQPVRDASLALDLWVARRTGVSPFHATNVLLWCAIVLLAHRLFLAVGGAPPVALAAAGLLALHPALAMAVAWVAARKHLLSCLFLLLATLGLERARRAAAEGRRPGGALVAGVAGAYALSVFSQPITLLFPLWAGWVALTGRGPVRRAALGVALACAPVMLACAWVNMAYYTGTYVEQGAPKFVGGFQPGVSALALGRAFFNLVAPVAVATTYEPGSPYNLAGLLLLVLFAWWAARALPWRLSTTWALFALLPLAVVLVRMTHVFLSDPYLLTPAVGLGCLGVSLAAGRRQGVEAGVGPGRLAALGVGGVGLALLLLLVPVVHSWRSEAALWARAADVSPSPGALVKHAFYLASGGETEEAIGVALQLRAWNPGHPEAGYVLGRAVHLDRTLSAEQKEQLLRENPLPGPWFHYYYALTLGQLGRFADAARHAREALRAPRAFRAELPGVAAEATLLCRRAGGADCEGLAAPLRTLPAWSEALFQQRLAQAPAP